MEIGLFDFGAATSDDIRQLFSQRSQDVGAIQALTDIVERCTGAQPSTVVADTIAALWCKVGFPPSPLPPLVQQTIFQAASFHWKLRIVHGLADSDNIDDALHLSGLAEQSQTHVLRLCIDLSLARRTFRRKDMLSALGALERATTETEWRFLRESVRSFVPSAALASFSLRHTGNRLRIDDPSCIEASTGQAAKAYPEINEQLFPGSPSAPSLVHGIPFDHILGHIERMIDARDFPAASDLLKIIADRAYVIAGELSHRRSVAALIMTMVDAGAPIPTRVLAYLLGELSESGGGRYSGQTLLKAIVDPEPEIGPQTYFLLRRACLMTADDAEARRVSAKVAGLLPAEGPGADKHRYFINGRVPEARTRDIGWQQERITALLNDLDVILHTPAARSAGRPRLAGAKRVALFLTGQLRSFEGVFATIKKEVIDPLNADLFIATWDSVGFALGAHDAVSRLVNPSIYRALPPELQSRDGFTQRFPKAMNILEGAKEDSASVIASVVGDVPHVVVDERRFEEAARRNFPTEVVNGEIPRIRLNQFKMFFLNRVCREMLEQEIARTGEDYDWVLRMRPDMDVQSFIHPLLTSQEPQDNMVTVHGPHPFGINDQFAYGSQRAMRHYFSCFDFLLDLGGFKNFAFYRDLYGEAFLFDCLSYWGVRVAFAPTLRYSLSATRLMDRDFARLLLKDCEGADEDGIGRMLRELVDAGGITQARM